MKISHKKRAMLVGSILLFGFFIYKFIADFQYYVGDGQAPNEIQVVRKKEDICVRFIQNAGSGNFFNIYSFPCSQSNSMKSITGADIQGDKNIEGVTILDRFERGVEHPFDSVTNLDSEGNRQIRIEAGLIKREVFRLAVDKSGKFVVLVSPK